MDSRYKFLIAGVALVFAFSYGYMQGSHNEHVKNVEQWAEYYASLNQANINAENQTKDKSIELQDSAILIESRTNEGLSVIDSDYDQLSNTNLFVPINSVSDDWLHTDTTSSSGQNDVSDNASASKRTTAKEDCKCNEANRAKLQRLYKQQLELARDFEKCQIERNEVIGLYEQVRAKINEQR